MFMLNGLSSGFASLIGFLVLCFFLLAGLLLVGVIAFVVIQRNKRTKELAINAGKIFQEVDFTDGLNEEELAIIQGLFAEEKQTELKAKVKERLAKVAGYETE